MTPSQRRELIRLSETIKRTVAELSKQNYASVEAALREVDRQLDLLIANRLDHTAA
jgi:hypothetical protein